MQILRILVVRIGTPSDKNVQKQANKAHPQPSTFDTKSSKGDSVQRPSTFGTQSLDSDSVNDAQRSLYRMTIDFRQINAVTTNQKNLVPRIQNSRFLLTSDDITTPKLYVSPIFFPNNP